MIMPMHFGIMCEKLWHTGYSLVLAKFLSREFFVLDRGYGDLNRIGFGLWPCVEFLLYDDHDSPGVLLTKGGHVVWIPIAARTRSMQTKSPDLKVQA